ncbi:MAG: nadD [Rickettsiaceae bacterium]|jgi:nicotinate-nucleotide adenylyltransferase|nr:nadD [Rickettsiaceae bacterium]
MKIGLLGGSFNPPHKGHIHASLLAKICLQLNQIWWLPTKQNPFKSDKKDFDQRMNWCLEITKNHPEILVKDEEKNLPSLYSIDLLEKIINQYPQDEFFFIIGADNIVNFHQWHRWQEIAKLVKLIVIDREDFFEKVKESEAYLYYQKLDLLKLVDCKNLPEKIQPEKFRCYFLLGDKCNISSTEIRNR